MGWLRRIASEVAFGLSLFGASVVGMDPREILRGGRARWGDAGPAGSAGPEGGSIPADSHSPVGGGRRFVLPGLGPFVEQPPPGHPERLVPDQPLTDEERRIWHQLW
ncbi:DUF6059 family protein [Salinispora cortesiana]|uniref:DUF6059 family protein n=1 Tax=Salinispora cortesiana TaxID=1305843 RepID=UPI00040B2B89|nr:DUF6059 family protein [Salinispora cortesiana]